MLAVSGFFSSDYQKVALSEDGSIRGIARTRDKLEGIAFIDLRQSVIEYHRKLYGRSCGRKL